MVAVCSELIFSGSLASLQTGCVGCFSSEGYRPVMQTCIGGYLWCHVRTFGPKYLVCVNSIVANRENSIDTTSVERAKRLKVELNSSKGTITGPSFSAGILRDRLPGSAHLLAMIQACTYHSAMFVKPQK